MKKKVKPLLPSLKERKRYLGFKVISNEKITDSEAVSREIWEKVLENMGTFEAAKAGVWVLSESYDKKDQTGVIRVNNKYVDQLKASLMFVEKIEDKDVVIKSINVSGMLNKAKRVR
ncbi:MAG: Rpp14/Pop5 family protein [Candidatus Woesearchaeota archaeon]